MRFLVYFFLFGVFLFASNLKIMQVAPFGTSSIKIVFNHEIKQADLRSKKIGNFRSYLEVDAVLIPFAKKKYNFPNQLQIVIAQNTPKVVRIVIVGNSNASYQTKIVGKSLYISFVDEIPLLKEKQDKNKQIKKENPSILASKQLESKKTYRIMIDPGHGGKDCGAIGVTKICEKTIVLSVGKFLEQELKKRGYTVFMTRNKDVYVDLKKRTEMANAKNTDLFISIHANSIPKTSNSNSQGVETYFLSTARSERARGVAEQENKGDVETMNYFSKLSFLNTLNSHRLIASNKLAIDVQIGILRELKSKYDNVVDGGVREGPFWVLAGALMPSVLIEIGYNSNEIESRRISNKEYQKDLAVGIANGIDSFIAKNF
ncbi:MULTISPECIES: N-acetylmuramoyl-L-alanine amidase family protein [unclassified Helicobacter]|uniref:N-acetylmuramoyl-L-alanine amidase family protein n=1 Tax=unclassified Helicobacter TaxID=2593540 RepID=UPI000CF0992D|nr:MULTISPECIES: N-acetylmuramoyl-L-alanine amidase [unclassified Helicobacter]